MTYLHRYRCSETSTEIKIASNACDDSQALLCVAAILLGCKTTENLRTMRDIFNVVYTSKDINNSPQQLDQVNAYYSQ